MSEPTPLHICPYCPGKIREPVEWAERGLTAWWVRMRCPECFEETEGVYGRAAVEILDDELDRAFSSLVDDAARMTRANMDAEIKVFHEAFEHDAILPEDFVV